LALRLQEGVVSSGNSLDLTKEKHRAEHHTYDQSLIDLAPWLQEGVVSSGNSLDFTKEDMERMLQHGVAVKEMEAAAIAWSAHLFGTPMFALKSITDIVDGAVPNHAACKCPGGCEQRKVDATDSEVVATGTSSVVLHIYAGTRQRQWTLLQVTGQHMKSSWRTWLPLRSRCRRSCRR
jgi:Phosphorylase superfamily